MNELLTDDTIISDAGPTRKERVSLILSGFGAFLFFFVTFTAFKVPRYKIESTILGNIQSSLAKNDIGFSAEETKLSLFPWISYSIKNATLTSLNKDKSIHVDDLTVTPWLMGFLRGRLGVKLHSKMSDGYFDAWAGLRGSNLSVMGSLDNVDIGRLGLLGFVAGLDGKGRLDGNFDVTLDTEDIPTASGSGKLEFSQFEISEQKFMGFSLPKLPIDSTQIETNIESGKLTITKGKIGGNTSGNAITGDLSGDVALARRFNASNLNLKVLFQVNEDVSKKFPLLETLLQSARQSDGRFGYLITGPLSSPMPKAMIK